MAGIEKSKWLNEQVSSFGRELSRLKSEVNKPKAVLEAEAESKKAEAEKKKSDENFDFAQRRESLVKVLKMWPQLMKAFTEAKKSDSTLYFSTFLNRGILTNTYSFADSAIKYSADNKTFSINYRDSKWKAHSLSYNTKDYVTAQWKSVNTTKLFLNINKDIKKVEWSIAKERKENNTVRGVESFDVRQFSKKAQAYLKEKDFLLGNNLNLKPGIGTWIAFDAKWNLHFWKAFIIPKAQVDSFYANWQFNAAKFKSLLGPNLDKRADKHFIAKADKSANQLKNHIVATSTITASETIIRNTEAGMKRIADLWVRIPEADQRVLDSKKNQLKIVKDYKEVSTWIDGVLSKIEKKINQKMSPVEFKQLKDQIIRIVRLCENKQYSFNGKNAYAVYTKMANWAQKYQNLVNKAKKIKNQII